MGNQHTNRRHNKKHLNIKEKKITIQKEKNIYKYNIVFVGETRIGTKTSLIQRIKQGKYFKVTGEHKEISEKIIYSTDDNKILLYLIDTNGEREKLKMKGINGEEEKRDLATRYYKNADCIVMGYDVTNRQSFEEMKTFWYKNIKEKTETDLIYLLGNKIDLKNKIEVTENEGRKFANENNIKYFPTSVNKNINIKNFIDDMKINIEKINKDYNNGTKEIIYGNPSKENYKVVFLGDSGVGSKTSFLNRLNNGKFEENLCSTNGASFSSKSINLCNGKTIKIDFWDTAGQERYRSLSKFFLYDSDCIVLGYDITRKGSFDSIINNWYPLFKDLYNINLIYLLGNKMDLIEHIQVNEEEVRKYAKDNNMRFFPVSCKQNKGINEFFEDLSNEIIKI